MALKDEKTPYEILVRFGDDGQPKGAHVLYRRVVTLDDEVLKDEILAAQPLDLEGFPTSAIMTDATRDALAKVSSQEAQIAALTEQLATANATIQELEAAAAALQA
ncbi:hypothetical protein [Rhizobium paknamense]|uniref:Uncharacterized protein n=1 Tax=Rhizobium paknamense TaxID=1206817 RepID=A0ABU0I914_9HYPH|nr:hypothetical protein [Rhizobium paknamense]MDQ0454726.1 hypothetical protein [Rhizobium paknamense]